MELVYLWVEEYKNIKNQGFNFSPRFKCEFKPEYDENNNLKDNCELIINENKDYVSIFPENINITAIVGENGSGKSSIVELIMLLYYKGIDYFNCKKFDNNWLISYEKNKKKFYLFSLSCQKIIVFFKGDNKLYGKNDFYLLNLYYNPSTELLSSYFLNCVFKLSKEQQEVYIYNLDYQNFGIMNIFSFPSKENNIIDIRRNEIISILNMFKSRNYNIQLKKIFDNDKIVFIPIKIKLDLNISNFKHKIKRKFIIEIIDDYKNKSILDKLYIFFIILVFKSAMEPVNSSDNSFKEFFSLKDSDLEKYFKEKYKVIDEEKNTDKSLLKLDKLIKFIIDNIYEFKDKFKNESLSKLVKKYNLDTDVYYTAKLIDILNENPNINLEQELTELAQIEKILPILPTYIKIEKIYDELGRNFFDFSTGEKNIISFIYSLMYYIEFFKEYKIINIVLDEVEIGFHPNWQKSLLNIIINLLKQFSNNKFIVTIASHSPFIISDIPKENVIFLKDGEQFYLDINTFGANIHTLLSHGFFMQDGLMGEFAKSRIEEIRKFYDENKDLKKDDFNFMSKKEEFEKNKKIFYYIQSIIGEPFLQTIIKNYLEELEQIFDDEDYKNRKKEELLKQFSKEEIEKYLESFNNAKN